MEILYVKIIISEIKILPNGLNSRLDIAEEEIKELEKDIAEIKETFSGICSSAAQPPGQLQPDRHVAVVAAGMHGSGMPGAIGCAGLFFNGQGVHVCPEGDGALGAEVEKGADAALHRFGKPAAQGLKFAPKIRLCLWEPAVQLRDLVQCPTVFNNPNGKCPLSVDDCFPIIDDVDGCVNFNLAFL